MRVYSWPVSERGREIFVLGPNSRWSNCPRRERARGEAAGERRPTHIATELWLLVTYSAEPLATGLFLRRHPKMCFTDKLRKLKRLMCWQRTCAENILNIFIASLCYNNSLVIKCRSTGEGTAIWEWTLITKSAWVVVVLQCILENVWKWTSMLKNVLTRFRWDVCYTTHCGNRLHG